MRGEAGVSGGESYGRMYRADTAPDHSVMMRRSRKKSRRCWKSWTRKERGQMPEIIKKRQQATTLLGAETTTTQLVQCHLAAWGLKALWMAPPAHGCCICGTQCTHARQALLGQRIEGRQPDCVRVCRLFAYFAALAISNVVVFS